MEHRTPRYKKAMAELEREESGSLEHRHARHLAGRQGKQPSPRRECRETIALWCVRVEKICWSGLTVDFLVDEKWELLCSKGRDDADLFGSIVQLGPGRRPQHEEMLRVGGGGKM